MRYCSNCGLMIKPDALECNFCGAPIQESVQNSDTQQPIEQPMGQYQSMGQTQPMGYQQYMNQQPVSQPQPMSQPQYMNQQQPMGQQQPSYHQPQQSYRQSPPPRQPTYQEIQQFFEQQTNYQNTSRQQTNNGSQRQAKPGNINVESFGIGRSLLVITILLFAGLILIVREFIPRIPAVASLLGSADSFRVLGADGMVTATYVIFFGNLIAAGSCVLLAIALVQIFFRKPTFLFFLQLSQFILVFANVLLYVAGNMVTTEINILAIEFPIFAPLLRAEIGFSQTELIVVIVLVFVITFLLTLYFSKSHSVWDYMRGEEFKRKALFAFNRPPE